jgi:SAM-dependent methyltransferase
MPWRKVLYRKWVSARHRLLGIPRTGHVSFGDLRRVEPFGRHFGTDRGQAIDRHYIEAFLQSRSVDVRGRVLEVGDDGYTRQFGGQRVTRSDVLHVDASNPRATIVADLANAPQIPDDSFDCIILTQVLHLIYEPRGAVRTLYRILKPGGVLILTTPGLSQVPHGTVWAHTWYWSFTELSTLRMLEEAFGEGRVAVESRGNVFSATAMLYGLAAQDLSESDLAVHDPDYPVIISARAQKRPVGG